MAIECWVYISQSDLAREKLWSVAVTQCLKINKIVSEFFLTGKNGQNLLKVDFWQKVGKSTWEIPFYDVINFLHFTKKTRKYNCWPNIEKKRDFSENFQTQCFGLEVMMKKEEMHNKKPHEFSNITFFSFFSTLKLHGGEEKGIFFLALTSWVSRKTEKELKCKIPTCFTENLSLQTRLIAEVKH